MPDIRVTLADGSTEQQEHATAALVPAVDAEGKYLGLVDEAVAGNRVAHAAPFDGARWDGKAWTALVTLEAARAQALAEVDAAAGAARMRFATEAPGQAVVYLRKAEQARQYAAAGYTGEPPPYIAREAAESSMTPRALADQIIATAAVWDDVLSPAIEAARMKAKRRLQAATTLAEMQNLALVARQALEALGL